MLVTGGSNFAEDLFAYTKANGIKVITTGNSHNQIMDMADEVFEYNTSDYEQMLWLVKNHNIDGIFAGGNEPNIVTAIKVSETAGLPYYCTMDQWESLMNKANFKNLCREFNIPVTKEYSVSSETDSLEGIEYPVIVKPVDSCGSKGVIYCENEQELKESIKEALKFSASKRVIVEQYVTGEEISATYTICNGEITLSCMKEKYPVAEQTGLMNMPNVFIYPSKHLGRYLEKVNDNAIAMLKSLKLQYGTLFLQGFVNDSGIYMFEAGYRPGGTNDFRYTDIMNGVNHVHILIEQALTGSVQDDPNSRDNPKFKQYCCSFTMCARGGHVGKVKGLEIVKELPTVKTVEQFYHEGDDIPFGKTLAQRMLRFFMMADKIGEIEKTIEHLQNAIDVIDENGNTVLYNKFDTKRLY